MIRNYITLAIRMLKKQKLYTFINIVGLSIGIATCLLILTYVQHELSYDRFHADADRIFRIVETRKITEQPQQLASSPAPVAGHFPQVFPDIPVTRFIPFSERFKMESGDKKFMETGFFFADPSLFEVFDFSLINGNENTVLRKPGTVLISETMAQKYFGEQSPLGKTLSLKGQLPLVVEGVFKNVPDNSHIRFHFLSSTLTAEKVFGQSLMSSGSWWSPPAYTYIKLPASMDPANVERQLTSIMERYPDGDMTKKRLLSLQPLTDIHLQSHRNQELQANNRLSNIYLFMAVAAFILVIACLNFVNLSTARSLKRAREVGMRKVIGATRKQLIFRFLSESFLLVILAFVIALALVEVFLPLFNQLWEKELSSNFLQFNGFWISSLLVIAITGLLAGGYPAFYLSAFTPAHAMRNQAGKPAGKWSLRRALVVVQFAFAILLMIGTAIILDQHRFIKTKNLGFDRDNILAIPIMNEQVKAKRDFIKNELQQNPNIKNVSFTGGLPGMKSLSEFPYQIEGQDKESLPNILVYMTDYDFVSTFDMELAEGRVFSREYQTDKDKAFLINEKAARTFGWDNATGKDFTLLQFDGKGMQTKEGKIIGVVKDFHFNSLHENIEPIVMEIPPADFYLSHIAIRMKAGASQQVIDFLESRWDEIAPGTGLSWFFFDEHLDKLYRSEQKLTSIFTSFSALAIFVACLGLFGLVSFMSEQRTREIAVRKVFGASSKTLTLMLIRDFTRWALLANIMAWPVAYYFGSDWLNNFAYRTPLHWWIFPAAAILTLIIAIATVSAYAIKTANVNPGETLKDE
ncbi:MAG: ABC transporter permease [Bacteroidales bacterium]|nr:ABC transporter permease [Bacteroidales bacterium]